MTPPLTAADLDEIEATVAKATKGPWKAELGRTGYGQGWRLLYHGPTAYGKHWEGADWAILGAHDNVHHVDEYSEFNARAIVALRNSADALIAALRDSQAKLAAAERVVDGARRYLESGDRKHIRNAVTEYDALAAGKTK